MLSPEVGLWVDPGLLSSYMNHLETKASKSSLLGNMNHGTRSGEH